MNWEFLEALKVTPAFEKLPETSRALLESIMSASTESIYTEVEELVPKIEKEVEVAAAKVVEVLAEVPKSSWMSRPKMTPTKVTAKDKKGKQPTIPVWSSPRINPSKPTAQEKGKAINIELEEKELKDIPMDDEDVGVDVDEVET